MHFWAGPNIYHSQFTALELCEKENRETLVLSRDGCKAHFIILVNVDDLAKRLLLPI